MCKQFYVVFTRSKTPRGGWNSSVFRSAASMTLPRRITPITVEAHTFLDVHTAQNIPHLTAPRNWTLATSMNIIKNGTQIESRCETNLLYFDTHVHQLYTKGLLNLLNLRSGVPIFFSRREGTPDTITWLFVCRPLIKISVSENVGDAISR